MADYYGMMLEHSFSEELLTEPDDLPRCDVGPDWAHVGAVSRTIFAIVGGHRVKLTRRIMIRTRTDGPGEVEGVVVGMAQSDGRILLGLDTGEVVNVTNPDDWWWEVCDAD